MGNTIEMQGGQRPIVKKNAMTSTEIMLAAIMLILAGLTGILPTTIHYAAILLVAVAAALTGTIYLMYPIMLFYGGVLGIFMGMSVYRWFTLLFLGITLLQNRSSSIQLKQLAVLFLFAVYCLIVIGTKDLRRALFAVLDMVSILMLVNCYIKDGGKLKKFFTVYVLCAFVAYFTGMHMDSMQGNLEVGGQYIQVSRNMATFEDPNYMGYFYTGAIFALVGLKLFKPVVRLGMVLALYALLFTSLSVTAVVVNILMWAVYLLVVEKLSPRAILVAAMVAVVILGVYHYGLANPNDPVVGALSMRVEEKLRQAAAGELGDATTNRTELAVAHLKYFWNQPLYKMLIGMNATSALRVDLPGIKMAAHNEYVDWLLNVGIIGTIIMVGYLFSTIWKPLKKYLRNREDRSALCIVLVKLVFALYAFSLTLYGDYRFMLFMLI